MATANIPPRGEMYDRAVRREQIRREQSTPDPVERYRLRESRLQRSLQEVTKKIINSKRR